MQPTNSPSPLGGDAPNSTNQGMEPRVISPSVPSAEPEAPNVSDPTTSTSAVSPSVLPAQPESPATPLSTPTGDASSSFAPGRPEVMSPALQAPANATVPQAPESSSTSGQSASVFTTVAPAPLARKAFSGKKRLLVVGTVAALLLIGGSAAAYVGVVVPNKPENIWKTALERTAQGYDTLVTNSVSKSKDFKSVSAKGDYKLEGAYAADGSFEMQGGEQGGTLKADFGTAGTRINFEGRMVAAKNSKNPDLYFKLSGLKGLGAMMGDYGAMVNQYDNQWLVVDHTLFDSLESSTPGVDTSGVATLSADDVTKIAKTVGSVNRDYLFTTDPHKAVFKVAKQLGKEKQDDRTVYHYQVGLDKQHTKDYLNALIDSLQNTPAAKLASGQKLRDDTSLKDLLQSVDNYNESDTVDVYVDTATKLVRTVHIQDKSNKQDYVDIGLHYTGGDVLPFVLTGASTTDNQQTTYNMTFNLNQKTLVTDGVLAFADQSDPSSKQQEKINITYSLTPSTTVVTAQKPDGAKSVTELLAPLITTLSANSSPLTPTASSMPAI